MWTLKKEFRFEAAHRLPSHDGKCARLHGHSWRGLVVVEGDQLHTRGSKAGMLVDFADVSTPVKEMVDKYLDHYYLNETLGLDNPTSERVAEWVFNYLKFNAAPLPITAIVIEETCTSSCEYRPYKPCKEDSPC